MEKPQPVKFGEDGEAYWMIEKFIKKRYRNGKVCSMK